MSEPAVEGPIGIDQLTHLERSAPSESSFVVERASGPTQAEVDQLTSRLYAALDAARGAEAERAASLARQQELEYQLHLCTAEIKQLKQAKGARLSAGSLPLGSSRLPAKLRRVRARISSLLSELR